MTDRSISEDKLRIGIFGGAFNPVHNGHLVLIDNLARIPVMPDNKPLDRVIIIPTANPPHKSDSELAEIADRLNMLELAINSGGLSDEIRDKLEISDIEFRLGGKSYTYNTLKALSELYPDGEFHLLIGSDQLLNFKSWYRYEEILKMAYITAFSRRKEDDGAVRRFLIDNSEFKDRADAIITKPFDVSSTQIRQKLRNGEDIGGDVPDSVKNYIVEKGLYSV